MHSLFGQHQTPSFPLVRATLFWIFMALILCSCTSSETKPTDIYPEDICSQCRMAISDQRFAAEIISDQNEVFKFDDLACMENFRNTSHNVKALGVFVKDYPSKSWIPLSRSIIVETDLASPMGSGKVAFSDSAAAGKFAREHPLKKIN